MVMGRPAKPTAVKRMEGRSPTRDRGGALIRLDELRPGEPGGLPEPPKELSKRARETWDFLLRCWANTGLLTEVDGLHLAVYCELYARFWELKRQGEFMDANGISQLRQFSGMFGLDPASRSRPGFPGNGSESAEPLEALRHRKREGA